MKVEYVEETSVRKALVFEVEPEVVSTEIEGKAKELTRKVKLPGFRPGRTPVTVIKQRFKEQVLEDAAEAIVNRVVFPEIEGRGLKPLGPPKVADLEIAEGQPLKFRAVFEVLPMVELPEYRGLTAKVKAAAVSDEDVAKEIETQRQRAARFEPIEGRPAARGDFAALDLRWRPLVGGKGGHDENALIEIGGDSNHEAMNAALQGMSVGETQEITIDYPADHSVESLAGKAFRYTVTLKALKARVLPALDDELAKDLGDWDDLGSMRADVRKNLEVLEKQRLESETREALLAALVERASFEVPEVLVEQHMNARTESTARGLAYRGIDPRKLGVNWQQFREGQRDASLASAKAEILIDEIARRENIDALPAEIDAELARLAERLGAEPAVVRRRMSESGELAAMRGRIREGKVLDLLKANARLEIE